MSTIFKRCPKCGSLEVSTRDIAGMTYIVCNTCGHKTEAELQFKQGK